MMINNKTKIFAFCATFILGICALLFVMVPTKQGIDYKVYTYKMPLYIKIIEFVDRDYQYRRIVKDVVAGRKTDEDKVLAIFSWCVRNVKHQPQELRVIDDHQLNIIIRGYGVNDQVEDLFTLLCTYAGFEAFYKRFYASTGKSYFISFVRLGDKWYAFSVWEGAYPMDSVGKPVSVDTLRSNHEYMNPFKISVSGFDANIFLDAIDSMRFEATSTRVRGQSPAGRVWCYVRKFINKWKDEESV